MVKTPAPERECGASLNARELTRENKVDRGQESLAQVLSKYIDFHK